MTDMGEGGSRPRRLLHGGEALRIDVRRAPTGPGDKHIPQTPEEARDILLPQIRQVVQTARTLPDELRARNYLYVEAKLLPNYIAPTYFPKKLLDSVGAIPVGSRADIGLYRTASKSIRQGTRRVVFTISDRGLGQLVDLVETGGQRSKSDRDAFEQIAVFDEIALPTTQEVLRAGAADDAAPAPTWEAVLHPSTITTNGALAPIEESTLMRWFALIEAEHGQVYRDFLTQVGGLTFVPVKVTPQAALRLSGFNPLRTLRPMPVIRPLPELGLRSLLGVAPPATPQPVTDAVRVAVFDGGIDNDDQTSELFPVTTQDLTKAPPLRQATDHGTGVTGAVLYGLVTAGATAPQPPLPVESFRVLPAPGDIPPELIPYWALDRIAETVSTGGHKLVNLSLGLDSAVEADREPNRWTSQLDQLAWDHGVLFVVAAGNNGTADARTGLNRVQIPADMANGLSVGSCDRPAPQRKWDRAIYSAVGPGRQGNAIQPVGVQFGGLLPHRPFEVLCADGTLRDEHGTSFAAPVVTHALADLVTRLPRVNSNVLRAFAVHFAERHSAHKKRRNEFGYGRFPLHYADILDCGPDHAHVLFVDTVTRGQLNGYTLPTPDASYDRLRVHITLAYASPVEPTQPTEYTTASLDLKLRPHREIFRFRPPEEAEDKRKSQTLDARSQEALDLMAQGWRPGQEPVTLPLGSSKGPTEHSLRESGKWETLRHHRISVDKDKLLDPRLEVSYLARRAGALDGAPTEVPFAVLVTIQDHASNGTLYDSIREQFRALQPVQRIESRQRTQIQQPRWE